MIVDDGFTADAPWQFLVTLNASPMFIPVFVEQERLPAPAPLNFSLRPRDGALQKQARETLVFELRRLAKAWIESGRQVHGPREEPSKRKLTLELRHVVNDWWAGNQPMVQHEESGEPILVMPACMMNFASPLDAAKDEAVRRFSRFLDSRYRYRLCQCRSCGEYYYTQRQPKAVIEYGTYCSRHRHLASAMRSNKQRRNPAHERRLIIAAEWWGKWPKNLKEEGKQAQWIAKKVNDNVSSKWTPISRNWVTLHWADIERRSLSSRGAAPVGGAESLVSDKLS